MLSATLESELGRWVVCRRDDAAAELALARVGAGGTAQTRVIDRCFIEDGVRWIVDYKTSRLVGEPTHSVLTAHAERYREQLEEYGALLAGEGLPQRLAVFYLAYGKLILLQ
jgi:ATP-dependent exoDNAse (exonuclease V) beta subunit